MSNLKPYQFDRREMLHALMSLWNSIKSSGHLYEVNGLKAAIRYIKGNVEKKPISGCCPRCGHPVDNYFCPECGQPLYYFNGVRPFDPHRIDPNLHRHDAQWANEQEIKRIERYIRVYGVHETLQVLERSDSLREPIDVSQSSLATLLRRERVRRPTDQ